MWLFVSVGVCSVGFAARCAARGVLPACVVFGGGGAGGRSGGLAWLVGGAGGRGWRVLGGFGLRLWCWRPVGVSACARWHLVALGAGLCMIAAFMQSLNNWAHSRKR